MVRKFNISFIFCMLCTLSANAQDVGVSYYAMQGFSKDQCAAALDVFSGVEKPVLAILWKTFGDDNFCIQEYLKRFSDKHHLLEIHVTNQTCLRNKTCAEGEIFSNITPKEYNKLLENHDARTLTVLKQRIEEVVAFVRDNRNVNTEVLLSTGLEDNYSSQAYQVVKESFEAYQKLTEFQLVRSPERSARADTIESNILELHGFDLDFPEKFVGRCLANNDGKDIEFGPPHVSGNKIWSDIPQYIQNNKKQGCRTILWWSGPQGRKNSSGVLPPPRKRKLEIRPEEIKKIDKLLVEASQ